MKSGVPIKFVFKSCWLKKQEKSQAIVSRAKNHLPSHSLQVKLVWFSVMALPSHIQVHIIGNADIKLKKHASRSIRATIRL